MNKIVFPEYQDHIIGIKTVPAGHQRFYVDIRSIQQTNMHHHDYAEFSFFIGGNGFEFINGVKHRLKPGTISFILPNHIHSIKSDPADPVRKYRCMFDLIAFCVFYYKISTAIDIFSSNL